MGPRVLAMRTSSVLALVARPVARTAFSRANSTSGVWEAARKVCDPGSAFLPWYI